ncbi:MAG TPA: ABC transporter permease [Candidatus Dormibacteraeota bacterium]|nr:ABC transporter permease [Candidatus Dormibacteraeota bacterium]
MFHPENWRAATDALWSNKLRAFLTTLGVVIGSAAIVLVITVAVSGSRYIIGQIEGVGANLVYGGLVESGVRAVTRSDEITLGDLQAIQQGVPQVAAIAGTHDMPMTVDVGAVARPVTLIGVTEDYARVRNLVIMQGRYFDQDDIRMRAKECVVTPHLALLAYPHQDPIGKPLRLGELKFTIIGVFRERVSTFGQSEIQRDTALVPFPLIQMFTGNQFVSTFYATCDRPQDVPVATREIQEVLRSRHRPGAEYQVQNLTSILDAARKISRALMVVLLVTAGIALLISGIGIMNIMLVTVTERTHEIGIRKAVGARKKEIMNQFLLEALIISLTGAVLGVGIAIALAMLARQLLPPEIVVPVPWIAVVLAFAVSCATGLLFGYLPANKAAKLQPTESLRYE